MQKGKFTPEEKLKILAEWNSGVSVVDLSQKRHISPATLYK